jgi:hypothetical protein
MKNGNRRRVVIRAATALAVLFAAAAFAQQDRHIELKDDGALVSVTSTGGEQGVLSISVASGERTATWKYDGLSLDPGLSEQGAVQIFGAEPGRLLFVHTYSRRDQWSLLVFDLDLFANFDEFWNAQGSIRVGNGVGGCPLGVALAEAGSGKPATDPAGLSFYCLKGRHFTPAPVKARGDG